MANDKTPQVDDTIQLLHPKYRPDIDGLRAVAVLSVVAFHAFPHWVTGGFIGVDIFFVISGFLISIVILGSLERNSFSFGEFYSRRIKRIFPALILVLLACYAFGWFALLADEYKQLGKHIAGGAGFVSNFILWSESGYFDGAAETKPLLHLWSLGIEEQFYMIWPLLLWFARKKGLKLLAVTIAVALLSLGWNFDKVSSDVVATFYSLQTRFWELLIGSVLANFTLHDPKLWVNMKARLDRFLGQVLYAKPPEANGTTLGNCQSLLGVLLIAASVFFFTKDSTFPGWRALLPTVGAALIISAGPRAYINHVILSHRALVWFGLISFPLYLWHWPILSFARIVESGLPSRSTRLAAIFLSIALAWLTYKLIERPIRFGRFPKYKTSLLVLGMMVTGYIGYNCSERGGLEFRENVKHLANVDHQYDWTYVRTDFCIKNFPFPEWKKYGWWFCAANKDEQPTLLVLGTSFANHLYPGLATNVSLRAQSILSIGACDPAWVEEAELTEPESPHPCSGVRPLHQMTLINNIVENSRSVKYVILSGLSEVLSAPYVARLKRRIDFFEKKKIKVIIFVPLIRLSFNIKDCFARPFKEAKIDCTFDYGKILKLREGFKPAIDAFTTTNPNVAFFDPNEFLCKGRECSLSDNGLPLFRDAHNHLSEYGSVKLSDFFVKWAQSHLPDVLSGAEKKAE